MPLEDLLAFYGYEPTIPVIAGSSADSSPSELADELPDMTLDKVSWNHFSQYYRLKAKIQVTSNNISLSFNVTKCISLSISMYNQELLYYYEFFHFQGH